MNRELLVTAFLVVVITAFTTPTVPYLRDFDTWYHYRLAEYTSQQGYRPSFDPLSNMGENIVYPPLLHYLLAIPTKVLVISVMSSSQLYPIIAGLVTLAFIFLFTREVFDERTAMLAVIFLALLPIFKATTSFGYSDHDALDYVFISSALFFFVKAMKREEPSAPAAAPSFKIGGGGWSELQKNEQPKNEKPATSPFVYYALAGISLGLFSLEWEGFPILVILLFGFMILSALLNSRLKLLDRDMVAGFLLLSVVSTVLASMWYGAEILPIFALEIFSAAFSYVAVRFENSSRVGILLAAILLVSIPLLYFLRGELINVGLTYLGLMERGVYLQYVAELQAPNMGQFSQLYGVQTLPFLAGLVLFALTTTELKRRTLFFTVCVLFFIFLAAAAIRFVQYLGIFASILSAYLVNRISEAVSKSVKKDAFMPFLLVSAALLAYFIMPFLPTMTYYISDDWHSSLEWLKNNSLNTDVVMSWWDYSPWVNGVADRKTVVNNQPPGRFDDSMIFFGTDDWRRAEGILEKYNVSYVVVSRGTLGKIYLANKFLNETISFKEAPPLSITPTYYVRFEGSFKTYFDPMSKLAWDEYPDGRKLYYREVGAFNDEQHRTQYFDANLTGADFNDDYLYLFSNVFIRIPKETKNRVFLNLMYENSTIPYLKLVEDSGEVRIYKVVK